MSENNADTETSISLKDELTEAFNGGAETSPPEKAVPVATPEQSAEPALEVPKHWSEADKQLFTKAPREIQTRWLGRETEYSRGIDEKAQALARLKRDYDPLDALLKPYDRELGLRGSNRQQLIESWANTYRYLAEKPGEALQWLANQYGVDPAQLMQQQSEIDPAVAPVLKEVTGLKSEIQAMKDAARQNEMQGNLSKVTAFAEAKDDAGKPLHPFFDEVAEDVVKLLRSGERDLQTAYNKAVRMNDQVFEKSQAVKLQDDQAKKDAEAKAKVDKAKRAAVGTSSEASGSTKPKSLREDLESAFSGWGQG
jgi:LysM repeat protein